MTNTLPAQDAARVVPSYAAWLGGLWLCRVRVRSGLVAVVVPSGLSRRSQPQRWIAIRWWNPHYADLLVMPTWRRELLVAA